MTIQPIINFYGSQPANPAIHEQVAIHMRKHSPRPPRSMKDRSMSESARAAMSGRSSVSQKQRYAALRDPYRETVWAMRDEGMAIIAIARNIGRSADMVSKIISEPRP